MPKDSITFRLKPEFKEHLENIAYQQDVPVGVYIRKELTKASKYKKKKSA